MGVPCDCSAAALKECFSFFSAACPVEGREPRKGGGEREGEGERAREREKVHNNEQDFQLHWEESEAPSKSSDCVSLSLGEGRREEVRERLGEGKSRQETHVP